MPCHVDATSYAGAHEEAAVKTVQMTLDEDLVARVDRVAKKLHTSRSAFTRDALRRALADVDRLEAEDRHRRGYEAAPAATGEFDLWEDEQVWID